ncbi:hypothetical protein EDC22_102380 [Tepidamorphus gemmatus]|uniref:Uncharacterized protein n=1 Tax=Tepidamorphus gemmatus TaxID=747076 RepID=A0A4R3MJT8_9HYPH|nr:hypothetical protein [Tepidamorphus gemmatus]TCT12694.1 hypothetical protein EDC22_102380 [Tepidamorphus gemmatus]
MRVRDVLTALARLKASRVAQRRVRRVGGSIQIGLGVRLAMDRT